MKKDIILAGVGAVKPQATVFMGHFFNGFHGSTPYR